MIVDRLMSVRELDGLQSWPVTRKPFGSLADLQCTAPSGREQEFPFEWSARRMKHNFGEKTGQALRPYWETTSTLKTYRLFLACFSVTSLGFIRFSPFFFFFNLWWSLCTLYLHACYVLVIVGDSGFVVVLVLRVSSANYLPCVLPDSARALWTSFCFRFSLCVSPVVKCCPDHLDSHSMKKKKTCDPDY